MSLNISSLKSVEFPFKQNSTKINYPQPKKKNGMFEEQQ